MKTLANTCLVVFLLLCNLPHTYAQTLLFNEFPRAGNVGIGTLNPAAALHIRSSDAILRLQSTGYYGFMQFSNVEGQKGYIGIYENKDDVEFGTSNFNTKGNVHLITNGSPKMTLNEAGFVGIGTTSPAHQLHVVGSRFRMEKSDDSSEFLELRTDNNLLSLEANEKDLYLRSNSHNTFVQPFKGAVGIATKIIPEGFQLAVGGKAIFEELYIDLKANWPDYVFTADYNRLSIAEVYEYIQCNGHLPWFKPASEMEAKGLDIAEVQRKSVEAIEVITTYVIDLNEEINIKNGQLDAMQTQLKLMQAQMEAMQTQLNQLTKNK